MRNIEFRGRKRYGDGTFAPWFYGWYIDYYIFHEIHDKQGVEHSVEPETVGEWTGLYDKHFRRIYEGDVLKFSWDSPCGLVEFLGMVKFRANDAAFRVWCDNLKDWAVFSVFSRNDMEVIGNIFDNPELKEKFGKHWEQE